jgi:NAD(P)-dependent dehydrogenase (short-subunit alcohol dehydrogenase family)
MASATPVALVTGASRGIGKAIAVELARAGHDVAITARTVTEGEPREHSSTLRKSDTRPIPGSLATTAALIEAEGRRALPVAADLLDRASVEACAARVLDAWGRVDVLVNNGRYIGPGHMDLVLDTPIELLDAHWFANVASPLVLVKALLPQMLERASGVVVDITSSAAWIDPPAPAGRGGWGLGYTATKAAMHRIVPILAIEHANRGVRFYNVQPGFVATERMAMDMADFGFDAAGGAPPEAVAVVVRWLVEADTAGDLNGQCVEAQELCEQRQLIPGFTAVPNPV